MSAQMKVIRLKKGTDLRDHLEELVQSKKMVTGFICGIIGSLEIAHLRLAGAQSALMFEGPLEIICGQGTLSKNGLHLHICISNQKGKVYAGHLLKGSIINTTAELTLLHSDTIHLKRVFDQSTGYLELEVNDEVND